MTFSLAVSCNFSVNTFESRELPKSSTMLTLAALESPQDWDETWSSLEESSSDTLSLNSSVEQLVPVTDDSWQNYREFCALLLDIDSVLTDHGISEKTQVMHDYEEKELDTEYEIFLQNYMLLDAVKNCSGNKKMRKLRAVLGQMDCFDHVIDNSTASLAAGEREDVNLAFTYLNVARELPMRTKKKCEEWCFRVARELLMRTEKKLEEWCFRVARSYKNELPVLPNDISLLPEVFEMEQISVEEKEECFYGQLEECHHFLLMDYDAVEKAIPILKELSRKYRIKETPKLLDVLAELLKARCNLLLHKGRVVECELMSYTYQPKTAAALERLHCFMESKIKAVELKIKRKGKKLCYYIKHQVEFLGMLRDYKMLMAKIKKTKSAL